MRSAPPGAAEIERLRAAFAQLARVRCAGRSPLWKAVCTAVADDVETLELMMRAPPAQRRPALLLAAIHDLLLGGTEHELGAHLPTAAAGRTPSGSAGALALSFCREHADALARTLHTRSNQTNEVNRSAALLPALVHAAPAGQPLRLVELGASAGLNLLLDRYAYRYDGAAPGGAWGFSPIAAPTPHTPLVMCRCEVDGELPPAAAPPLIAERIGVDLHPVDLRDEAATRWLLACTWPDELDRVARLHAAIALARRDPPAVVQGDGLALLAELARGGHGLHPVLWHSWVLAYWPPARQRALTRAICELGTRRDLTWIYLEQPSETPALPTPVVAGARHDPHDSALVAVSFRDGVRTVRRLADAHPHVRHLRWLAA